MPGDVEIKELKHKPDCACPICSRKRAKASGEAPAKSAPKRTSKAPASSPAKDEGEVLDVGIGTIILGVGLAAVVGLGIGHLVGKFLKPKDETPATNVTRLQTVAA